MAHPSKIATCCHCGTRAMLTLDAGHHTLGCRNCGAPLRDLKAMPMARPASRPAISHQPAPKLRSLPKAKSEKPRRRKKRKSLWRKVASEAFEFVEDIFD